MLPSRLIMWRWTTGCSGFAAGWVAVAAGLVAAGWGVAVDAGWGDAAFGCWAVAAVWLFVADVGWMAADVVWMAAALCCTGPVIWPAIRP